MIGSAHRAFRRGGRSTQPNLKSRKTASTYGVNVSTTVWTALLVPFTTLCATFLAVCALSFATFLAVLTGPASAVPMAMASARTIEKNAFIVLNNSFLTAHMRLPDWLDRQPRKLLELGPPGFEPGTKGL